MVSPTKQPRLWRPTLSESLREAIRSSSMSVYRLAKEAGVAPAVITRFLKGERDLRLATVEKIAEVLQLELVQRRPLEPAAAAPPPATGALEAETTGPSPPLRDESASSAPPELQPSVLPAARRQQA